MAPDDSAWIHEITWQDFEAYVESEPHPTVLVPVGSTEQHGPHLPLGVDALQARDVAEAIAERTGVLSAPPLWYGDAAHHLAFPGTISLSSDTLVSVLTDVYESLLSHGVENVITINGHRKANNPAIRTAQKRVADEHPDAFLATIDVLYFAIRLYEDLRESDPEAGIHGGEFETSVMMHGRPDLVKESEFVPESEETWSRFVSDDFVTRDDAVITAPSGHDWSENALGHQGDPTTASAEKGEAVVEGLVENAVEFLDDLHAHRERSETDDGGDGAE